MEYYFAMCEKVPFFISIYEGNKIVYKTIEESPCFICKDKKESCPLFHQTFYGNKGIIYLETECFIT